MEVEGVRGAEGAGRSLTAVRDAESWLAKYSGERKVAFLDGGRRKSIQREWESGWSHKSKVLRVDLTEVAVRGLLHNRVIEETAQQEQKGFVLRKPILSVVNRPRLPTAPELGKTSLTSCMALICKSGMSHGTGQYMLHEPLPTLGSRYKDILCELQLAFLLMRYCHAVSEAASKKDLLKAKAWRFIFIECIR